MRRDHSRLRAYNTLLEQMYHRIYATSQLPGAVSSILYSVPPFILGLPKFHMEDCIVYLVWQLRDAGFKVQFTWPNLLTISWKHHEGEYLKTHNPIIQAMTPEQPQTQARKPPAKEPKKSKKEQGGQGGQGGQGQSKFQEEIAMITNYSPSQNHVQWRDQTEDIKEITIKPTTKRASEYQPPTSFLQQMDRPVKEKPANASSASVLSDLWSIR